MSGSLAGVVGKENRLTSRSLPQGSFRLLLLIVGVGMFAKALSLLYSKCPSVELVAQQFAQPVALVA